MRAAVARLKTTDEQIPEMVLRLLLELQAEQTAPQPKAHVHQCRGCCARWDEGVNE